MPGIAGVCGDETIDLDAAIETMVQLPWHRVSRTTSSGETRGACVALTSPIATARTLELGSITAWIHGEIYSTSDAELVRDLFAPDATTRLDRADGNFAIVAWHRAKRQLRLATDRLGLRHLYWSRAGRGVAWASDAKACALVAGASVRTAAAGELLEAGHLHGAGTWFEGVELLPAATLRVFDLADGSVADQVYWRWPASPLTVGDAELAHLRRRIVQRWREVHEEHAGRAGKAVVTLSGGHDSRWILAALQATGHEPTCVTFGRPACLDVTIAREVAARTHAPHDVCELTEDNWLDDRELATWITDGQFDLRHMHVVRCLRRCIEVGDVVYNGFSGDSLLGGTYLSSRWSFGERHEARGRRMISEGTRMSEAFLLHRLPFCDREMVELAFAVPEALRRGGWFYRDLLCQAHPALFGRIGHTPHGARPTTGPIRRTLSAARHWVSGRYHYHAYRQWVTSPRSARRLAPVLAPGGDPAAAAFASLLDERAWRAPVTRWQRAVERGRAISDRDATRVLRLAGMGIWLAQIQTRLAIGAPRRHRDVA